MEKFIGTKIVSAEPMTRGEYAKFRGWQFPADLNPNDAGYKVVYPEGYFTWFPASEFEETYRPCEAMTFGLAIEALKKGKRVARKGWNGKGMFLLLADEIDFHTPADLSCMKDTEGDLVRQSIVMKTADNKFVVGWLASQTDMLADDWMIVE